MYTKISSITEKRKITNTRPNNMCTGTALYKQKILFTFIETIGLLPVPFCDRQKDEYRPNDQQPLNAFDIADR